MRLVDLLGTAQPAHGRRRFGAWQVELTTRCALRCRMCIREGEPRWRSRDMTVAEFVALAPGLREVETVVLQGWGEPLLHHALVEVVRLARGSGGGPAGAAPPRVGFVTSGNGLDARYAAELVRAGVDFIGFSVAGASPATHAGIRVGSELDEVLSAAAQVAAARRREGKGTPRTHLVFLAMRDNLAELPALPAIAACAGCDELVVTNLVHAVDGWQEAQSLFGREPRGEHEEVLEEAERRARALGVSLRRASLAPAPAAVCEEDPLRNLYVTADGEVSPCVYLCPPVDGELTRRVGGHDHRLARTSFGNALRAGVAAVWDAPAYAAFRERFARRARAQRLGWLAPSAWRRGAAGAGDRLPAPPAPCLGCPKLLGA